MDYEIWIQLALLLFLAAAACEDYRCQKLSVWLLAAGGAAGLLLRIGLDGGHRSGSGLLPDLLPGVGVGAVMLLVSFATRQALGYGDGLLMTVTGTYLGGTDNLVLLLCSLVIAAFGSIVLLTARRKKGKDRIPFAPFVLGGFIVMKGVFG